MHYKSYPNKKSTPSRMTRKHTRHDVFVANKKMAKARRKAARLARRQKEGEE
jgi:hypothetical protein